LRFCPRVQALLHLILNFFSSFSDQNGLLRIHFHDCRFIVFDKGFFFWGSFSRLLPKVHDFLVLLFTNLLGLHQIFQKGSKKSFRHYFIFWCC
jgi:hypothetical protein